jgi:hypothetical protein
MKLNLNNFGKRLKLIKRTKKAKEISELDLFVESVGMMDHCWERSNNLYEVFGLNTLEYEESYYQIIEDLLLIKYGYWKTVIILWYVFGRKDEEGELPKIIKKTLKSGIIKEYWLHLIETKKYVVCNNISEYSKYIKTENCQLINTFCSFPFTPTKRSPPLRSGNCSATPCFCTRGSS